MKGITVAELIAFLQTQPQDIFVAFRQYSECALMDIDYIGVSELCYPRDDGWLQNKRPDKPSQTYLVFPGN